jgi:hypothetical protein
MRGILPAIKMVPDGYIIAANILDAEMARIACALLLEREISRSIFFRTGSIHDDRMGHFVHLIMPDYLNVICLILGL